LKQRSVALDVWNNLGGGVKMVPVILSVSGPLTRCQQLSGFVQEVFCFSCYRPCFISYGRGVI
jgi:hypothetical protein